MNDESRVKVKIKKNIRLTVNSIWSGLKFLIVVILGLIPISFFALLWYVFLSSSIGIATFVATIIYILYFLLHRLYIKFKDKHGDKVALAKFFVSLITWNSFFTSIPICLTYKFLSMMQGSDPTGTLAASMAAIATTMFFLFFLINVFSYGN